MAVSATPVLLMVLWSLPWMSWVVMWQLVDMWLWVDMLLLVCRVWLLDMLWWIDTWRRVWRRRTLSRWKERNEWQMQTSRHRGQPERQGNTRQVRNMDSTRVHKRDATDGYDACRVTRTGQTQGRQGRQGRRRTGTGLAEHAHMRRDSLV